MWGGHQNWGWSIPRFERFSAIWRDLAPGLFFSNLTSDDLSQRHCTATAPGKLCGNRQFATFFQQTTRAYLFLPHLVPQTKSGRVFRPQVGEGNSFWLAEAELPLAPRPVFFFTGAEVQLFLAASPHLTNWRKKSRTRKGWNNLVVRNCGGHFCSWKGLVQGRMRNPGHKLRIVSPCLPACFWRWLCRPPPLFRRHFVLLFCCQQLLRRLCWQAAFERQLSHGGSVCAIHFKACQNALSDNFCQRFPQIPKQNATGTESAVFILVN